MTYIAPNSLQPTQEAAYGSRRSAADLAYKVGLANKEFQRGQITAQQNLDRPALLQKLQQMREKMNPAFNRRGMLGSGLFQRALREHAQGAQQQVAGLDLGYAGKLGELGLNQQQLEMERAQQQAQIDQERAAALQQLAAAMIR